jgi:MSHA pilin protein MshB
MNNSNKGFSLVELVIVIVVLGLLAVAALPKFLDVTDEAKKASIEGVAGGFATAVLSARAQWEAEVRPQETVGTSVQPYVDYDGTEFWLTRSQDDAGADTGYRDGYPLKLKTETYGDISSEDDCVDLMDELLQNPPLTVTKTAYDADNTIEGKYSAEVVTLNTKGGCKYVQLEGNTEHYFEYDATRGSVKVTLQ